jgi:tetratricopeptide (TPR) repeat protein
MKLFCRFWLLIGLVSLKMLTVGQEADPAAILNQLKSALANKEWDQVLQIYLSQYDHSTDTPQKAKIAASLGGILYQKKEYLKAIEWYNKSVFLNPKLSASWAALGHLHEMLKDDYLAISYYSRAVHEEMENPQWHNALAVVAKKMGWVDVAEHEWQKAVQLDRKAANVHFNLSLLYLEKTPPLVELARRHYQLSLECGAEKDAWVEEQLKKLQDQ